MAETAKKGKKKKGKTVALTEFLANDGESGPTVSHAAVFSARSTSWADESEGLNTEVDTSWPEESYGGVSTEKKLRAAMDRASLPTAPRASRGPDIDSSKIPDGPPFTAFLGNLSYDVDKDDILEFFGNTKIIEVRLPQDTNGRLKGFGYAEFEDKNALLDALALNNEHLKSRRIRVDVAGQQQQERGDRDSRSSEPDRTDSDWRSKPAESSRDHNGYNDRDRYMNDDGPQDRWGQRAYDDGPSRDRPGFRSYDDGPRDRSGYRGFDDGPPRDRYGSHRGYEDGPRSRDYPQFDNTRYGDAPRDRRGADYYGDRDRSGGFGSRWGHGDRPDDRNYYRYDDRGGYGRDRYDGRRYGDRYSGDRYDSRGGYGRDRYDDRRYGDRDRYDDRRGADRYGDSERRREYDDGPSWRNMSRARDSRSDFDRDEREPVRERPKLQLKPRTKSAEENEDVPAGSSSVFGNARPVNTAAKEREIEEKLARQKLEEESTIKEDKENFKERRERDDFPRGDGCRSRHDSNRSSDGERVPRDRRDSPDGRGRRDSARSSDDSSSAIEIGSTPQEPRKETRELPKEVSGDVPPPPENVWAKRMEQQKAASSGDTDKSESKAKVRSPVTSPPRSPERKGLGRPFTTKKDSRESRESSGVTRAGRGRGNRSDRIERNERSGGAESSQDRGGRGVRKERRERKPMEPKKYDETQTPVFHTASKFSALMADEDASEQDTEQNVDTEEQV